MKMDELNVYKLRFYSNGELCNCIVLAESVSEAYEILRKDYEEFNIAVLIEEFEQITDKGVALTSM
jgi:hypothetical protein